MKLDIFNFCSRTIKERGPIHPFYAFFESAGCGEIWWDLPKDVFMSPLKVLILLFSLLVFCLLGQPCFEKKVVENKGHEYPYKVSNYSVLSPSI